MNARALFSSFGVLALASVLVVACSSSSDSGGNGPGGTGGPTSCPGPYSQPSSDSPCGMCELSKCQAQLTAAFGANFDGNGAACSDLLTCMKACACNDTSCYANCGPKAQEASCQSAIQMESECKAQMCATECGGTGAGGNTGAGGSTGGGGSPGVGGAPAGNATFACMQQNECVIGSVPSAYVDMAKMSCTNQGGMALDTCPSANLDGCCKVSGAEVCYYSGMAANEMMQCSAASGTWSTTP